MDRKDTVRTLLGMHPRHSVLLEAKHGVGKSEIIAQTASLLSSRLGKPFGFVDIRLGQYEVGDLIGIPRTRDKITVTNKVYTAGKLVDSQIVAENITVHDLPLWFPRDPLSHGFLFFDELNRGSRDTQQWAMQVVLDYRANFVDVPPGWRVVAACNDDYNVYSILGMDPALYSRFMVIKFRPTPKEWLEYAASINVLDAIVKYVTKFPTDLDAPEKIEIGKTYPCRRSWVKLSEDITTMAEQGDDVLHDHDYLFFLAEGWVGNTVAVNFAEFIKKDYEVFTGEEILNNFPKLKEKFEKMVATDYTYYNKVLIGYIAKEKVKLSKRQGDNLFDYITMIPRAAATGFWAEFSRECRTQANEWFKESRVSAYVNGLYNKEASTK